MFGNVFFPPKNPSPQTLTVLGVFFVFLLSSVFGGSCVLFSSGDERFLTKCPLRGACVCVSIWAAAFFL